eukprot:2930287-Prymnesium_polylepis.1
MHGGASLDVLEGECPTQFRGPVFTGDFPPIPWLRARPMQRGSLVLIMEAILYASPKYAAMLPPPMERRQLRNRLLRCERDSGAYYKFPRTTTLFVSEHNPGAEAVAQQLMARTHGLNITDTYSVTASASQLSTRSLPHVWISPNASCSSEPLVSASINAASTSGSRCAAATPISHFL